MMQKIKPLPISRLMNRFDPAQIPWETSDAIPRKTALRAPQPRALQALDLALHINAQGYNIFLSGESALGRIYMLRDFLEPKARKSSTPPDLAYVNNFADPDRPRLLYLPTGSGRRIKDMLHAALADIRKELPLRLECESFVKKRAQLFNNYQDERALLLRRMERLSLQRGFNLEVDEQGNLTLYPLVDGKRLGEADFESLEPDTRQSIKQKGDTVLGAMTGLVRRMARMEKEFRAGERGMEQEVARSVLDDKLEPAIEKIRKICPGNVDLNEYLADLRMDIQDNFEQFIPREPNFAPGLKPSRIAAHHAGQGGQGGQAMPPSQDVCPWPDSEPYRYDINLLVDNSKQKGAPIIIDDHPTLANLLGCIEREAELGALITDFTLIKAGSLHKANGGFLILRLEDILQCPNAWDGLLRSLRAGVIRLEDTGDGTEAANRTKGIEPQALKLNLKVILVGNEYMYENLLMHDERFPKLFKIKAHMTSTVERNFAGIRAWVLNLKRIIDEANLLPFARESLAGLVDYGSRLCEDQKKLSLKFPQVRDVMIEASALAAIQKSALVERRHLDEALSSRIYRANLVEEVYMEDYDREQIKVRTSGAAIGRVNGLSAAWYGDFEFGLPHQISGTVGVGHGGIIDLERESELGGPIHTKAMLILKSYLVDQFAQDKPLVFTGSLCFEQNYGGVEGDSASGAELAALLSAIAQVPIRQSLAFTGAVSQSGQIMAVGSVNRKIEGFFEVCNRRGLNGQQGVIIPHDNIDHLMLAPRVVEAVAGGRFNIYPVRHVAEALELLTGISVGKARKRNGKRGSFTPGSLYDLVDKRLQELGRLADIPNPKSRAGINRKQKR